MGTDLHTPTPTSGGWYQEQPAVQVQAAMPAVSLPHKDTAPKDPGQSDEKRMDVLNVVLTCSLHVYVGNMGKQEITDDV